MQMAQNNWDDFVDNERIQFECKFLIKKKREKKTRRRDNCMKR